VKILNLYEKWTSYSLKALSGYVKTLPPLTSGRHGLACSTLNTDFIVSGSYSTTLQAQKLNLE
jgi:hypothetical protein